MKAIRDRGAVICAGVAIVLALVTWVRADGGRSQQLADLTAQVQTLEVQLQHMQSEMDSYFLAHDGH